MPELNVKVALSARDHDATLGAVSEPVKLTVAPSGPIAEMICTMLRDNGIEAFTRATSAWGGGVNNALDPAYPAEVWVRDSDVEQARKLID